MSGPETIRIEDLRDPLARFVARRLRDQSLRDDVVQETLARLIFYRRRHAVSNLFGLGRKIARNLINDHFRLRSRLSDEPPTEQVPCSAPLPEDVLMHRQRLAVFSRALDQMPSLRREVLIRRRLHGQSHATIAVALSISTDAVEKHIARALRQLHELLKEDER